MSQLPGADQPSETPKPAETPLEAVSPFSRVQKRRDRIADEIERNRRGEYSVPTWVLALILLAVIGGWAALIFLS
jgi:hypothetical protein